MSDTQRTEDVHYDCASEPDDVHRYMKMRDFARQLERELAASEAERLEQARLLGMSAERELKLRAELAAKDKK